MTMLLALVLLAQATAPAPTTPEPEGELPPAASLHARKRVPANLKAVEGHLAGTSSEVLADDVVDEMLDEFAADVARLGAAQVGPILMERVRLSDNVNPAYAGVLEARLAAAVFRSANVALVRCLECTATRSRVDGGEWVVSRGLTTREEMQSVARKYGARSFLDVGLTVREHPASMGMEVEMVRAQDSSIAFAETYRMDAAQGMLYRRADRAQSREEKLKELEARLNHRPRWSQALEGGVMGMIGDQTLWGGVARFQLMEEFGDERQMQAGIAAGGFFNTTYLSAAIISAAWQARIGQPSLYASQVWLGLDAGAIISSGASSWPLLGVTMRWVVGERIALHGALRYMAPLHVPNSNQSYGSFAPELGVGFVWN